MERVPVDWQAAQWGSGRGDGIFITIFYHSKRFHVSLLPPSTPDTIEGPLILRFDATADEDIEAITHEIEKLVYEAGEVNLGSTRSPTYRRRKAFGSTFSPIPRVFLLPIYHE
jgi:hypothetical protein